MPFEFGSGNEGFPAEHVLHVRVLQLQSLSLDSAEEIPSEIEIFRFAGGSVQLNQRHLEFGMPGHKRPLGGAEIINDVVGETDSRVQERSLTRRPVTSNSGLNQVTQAVIFVRAGQLGKTQLRFVTDVVRIQITAWFLSGDNIGGEPIDITAQRLLVCIVRFVRCNSPSRTFHPFVDVGIGVKWPTPGHILSSREAPEVVDRSVLFEQCQEAWKTALGGDLSASAPEALSQMN